MTKVSDAAWGCILRARGHVQGKVFRMSPLTLAVILQERGERVAGLRNTQNPFLSGRSLYSVPVLLDPTLPFGTVELKERAW